MSERLTAGTAVQWAEGSWTAVVTPNGLMLLPPEVSDELVNRVWRLLRSGSATMTDVLDELLVAQGGRIASIPDFALLLLSDNGDVHLALRGVPALEVDGEIVDARAVSTWCETVLPAPSSVQVRVHEAPGARMRPVVDGVVAASVVRLGDQRTAAVVIDEA
ncbi:hypothetical protein [Actinomyces weissii]|uniref:Uncharacterized protein n=1 Tax=Actinomyces weissii TaxID=675090 RepID=A0A7T7S1P6_9ACTO|nr:hypothetical protein [Actinomyces weissii]QQM67141.1 hypothetical protein JG540_08945 [Actinomyces weissii]